MIPRGELLTHSGCIHRINSGCISPARIQIFLKVEDSHLNANISQKSKEKILAPMSVHADSYVTVNNVNAGVTVQGFVCQWNSSHLTVK